MAFASMPQPQTASAVAKTKLLTWLGGFDPIPDTMTIGSRVVTLKDLAGSIAAFREQRRFLADFGSLWPSAQVTQRVSNQQLPHWIPIDLRDLDGSGPHDPHELHHDIGSGVALQRAKDRAQAFGLPVSDRPLSESDQVFTDMLSEIVGRRYNSSSTGSGSAPPTSNFEVTTDSQGVEVIYADGYFLSTSRGFGYSSPAQKPLPYGNYIFGYNSPRGPDYLSGTLWIVPDDSRAHLRV